MSKYLDKSEIIKLGWSRTLSSVSDDGVLIDRYRYFEDMGNVYEMTLSEKYLKIIAKGLDAGHNITLFKGNITNSNELKTLMGWLGIVK